MKSVYLKEINSFLSSLVGYLTISIFLLITGLFVWVFPDTSILEYGFATLDSFFTLAPWVFVFLIPAITMRSFAEERRSGTFEILLTRPITELQLILGKYLAALTLVVIAIIPTFFYYYTVHSLGNPVGNMDSGAIWSSYFGLLLLASSFTMIGIFTSSITDNQIVAFLAGMFLCFFFYVAFDYLSGLQLFYAQTDHIIQLIGIEAHYTSISKGLIDSRDLVYFLSLNTLFFLFTKTVLQSRKW